MKINIEKQEMKTFIANGGKVFTHYKRHKANARQVQLDIFNKFFKETNGKFMDKKEANIYTTGFNSGYNEYRKRNGDGTDYCLNCKIQLGFKGFCSKACHKKYFRKPDGRRNRASKRFHELNSLTRR